MLNLIKINFQIHCYLILSLVFKYIIQYIVLRLCLYCMGIFIYFYLLLGFLTISVDIGVLFYVFYFFYLCFLLPFLLIYILTIFKFLIIYLKTLINSFFFDITYNITKQYFCLLVFIRIFLCIYGYYELSNFEFNDYYILQSSMSNLPPLDQNNNEGSWFSQGSGGNEGSGNGGNGNGGNNNGGNNNGGGDNGGGVFLPVEKHITDTQRLADLFEKNDGKQVKELRINTRIIILDDNTYGIDFYNSRTWSHIRCDHPEFFTDTDLKNPSRTRIDPILTNKIRALNKDYPSEWPPRLGPQTLIDKKNLVNRQMWPK